MLNKIVRKSLLKSKILILAVFVLFSLAMSLLFLSQTTYDDIQDSYDNYKISSNFEDYRVYIMWGLEDNADSKWEKEFANEYDSTIEKKEYFLSEEEDRTYGVERYDSDASINKIVLDSGSLPSKKGEIVIQPEVFKRQNFSLGDKLTIANKDFTIVGTAYMPSFTFPADVLNGNFSIGTDDFVPVYMYGDSFDEVSRDTTTYYSANFNNDVKDKQELFKNMQKEYMIDVPLIDENGNVQIGADGSLKTTSLSLIPLALDEKFNAPISSFEAEINGEKTMTTIISIVVVFIAIMVTIVLFNSIFNSQKREMGILKAEGFTTSKLSLAFLAYLVVVLILATIVGIVLGGKFKTLLIGVLSTLFSFPMPSTSNDVLLKGMFIIFIVNVIVVLLVYFLAIKKNLKIKPLVLIKNISVEKTPKFKFNFITKKMSFLNKYKFNILTRNISISLLLVFGVFVSSFLLIMGGTMYKSVHDVTNSTYSEIFTYNYEAVYSDGVKDKVFDNNSIIKKTVTLRSLSSDYDLESNNANVKVYAYDFDGNDFIKLSEDSTGEAIDKDKIYLTALMAKKYDLEVGDKISFNNPYDTEDKIEITVDGITDDPINNYIYMDIDKAQNLFSLDKDFANGEVGDEDKKDELLSYDKNISYRETLDLENNLKALTKVTMVFIVLIAIVSFIISFITLTMITHSVIKKNKKTISVMKVLGYTNKEIRTMTTSVYKWILIVVYFVSIPIFKKIIQTIIDVAFKDLDFSIKIHIGIEATLFGFVIILLVYFVAMFLSSRQIKKIKLSESLKADE